VLSTGLLERIRGRPCQGKQRGEEPWTNRKEMARKKGRSPMWERVSKRRKRRGGCEVKKILPGASKENCTKDAPRDHDGRELEKVHLGIHSS